MKHLRLSVEVYGERPKEEVILVDVDGKEIATIHGCNEILINNRARRICDCVNAMDGIDDPISHMKGTTIALKGYGKMIRKINSTSVNTCWNKCLISGKDPIIPCPSCGLDEHGNSHSVI